MGGREGERRGVNTSSRETQSLAIIMNSAQLTFGRRSSTHRCVSVPPETMSYPMATRVSAIWREFLTTCS